MRLSSEKETHDFLKMHCNVSLHDITKSEVDKLKVLGEQFKIKRIVSLSNTTIFIN